jgi:hypothetical protein
MPKIRELTQTPPMAEGDAEAQVEALRDYLLRITEELTYLLTHLEADNINDSTFERIAGMIPKAAVTAPPMDGEGSAGSSATWARGDHQHPKDRDKADVSALAALAAELAAHVADKLNPHEVTAAQVGYDNSESGLVSENVQDAMDEAIGLAISLIPTDPADIGAIPTSEKGSAGGVAELDSSGHVPSSQLPSYVDDVLEYPSVTDFPIPGESGKIYLAIDTNLFYRWGGTTYGPTNPSLALGETSETAYRGDRGKAAYDHSQTTSGNPHNVSASDVGLGNVANERQYSAQNPPPAQNAAATGYDGEESGLEADNVQEAIDLLAAGGGGGGAPLSDEDPQMDGEASPGEGLKASRDDHTHPHDDTKQDVVYLSIVSGMLCVTYEDGEE